MATIPPPIPPQEAARRARDAWHAQAAAQKAQYRAQKQYWRSMRRPSITGPFVLILIGVMALLLLTGKINSATFWTAYQHWWPLLFIVVGLGLLLEWFLDRNQPYPVRRTTGGLVFLLILAGVAGTLTWAHWNWGPLRDQFANQDGDFMHMMGAEHVNENQLDMSAPAAAIVQVDNSRGDVVIVASQDSEMHIHSRMTAYTNSDDEARRLLESLKPNVTVTGQNVNIHVPGSSNGKSDMTIDLPADASVTINAGHGDININGLKGETHSMATHGDIKLENLGAAAYARMSKGDFSAHGLWGDLSVEGRMDDVTLSEIRGKVLLDGDFFGDMHMERIQAPLHLHSSRTDMEVARIAGDLTMDSNDLRMQQVQGPIKVITHSKSIDLNQVYGDIHIENADNDVTVTSGLPLGNVYINNRHASINMGVPTGSSFSVDARAQNGEISTDFSLKNSHENNSSTLSGEVGNGGAKIVLNSDQGDIHLTKAEMVAPLPPLPPIPAVSNMKGMPNMPNMPAMPKMPKVPNVPGKHLKAPDGTTEQPVVQ
jgi:Putative adhesin